MGKKTVQTLADLALLATISPLPVSRALNHRPLLPAMTTARMQAIAWAYHFRSNVPIRNRWPCQSPPIAFNHLLLTTIRQTSALAGHLLAPNLMQHIQTGVVTNVITPVELVKRESA